MRIPGKCKQGSTCCKQSAYTLAAWRDAHSRLSRLEQKLRQYLAFTVPTDRIQVGSAQRARHASQVLSALARLRPAVRTAGAEAAASAAAGASAGAPAAYCAM